MEAKIKLTWYGPRKCWKKYIGGTVYYFAKRQCQGPNDLAGFQKALGEYRALRDKLDQQQGEETERQVARAVLPNGSSVDTTTAYMDWSKFVGSGESDKDRKKQQATVGGLVNVYLEARRTLADSGQIAVCTYSSEKLRLATFLSFCHFLGKGQLSEVLTPDFLGSYRTTLLKAVGQGQSSIVSAKNCLKTLKACCEWAYDEEILDSLPRRIKSIASVKLPAPNPQSFTPDEVKALFQGANDRMKLFLLLGLNLGYTQVDIATLEHPMVDWTTGIVTRGRHKTGQPQQARLWPITLGLLREHATDAKTGLVLLGENGNNLLADKIKADGNSTKTDSIRLAFGRLQDQLNMQALRTSRPELFTRVKGQEASKTRKREIHTALMALRDKRGFKVFRKTGADQIAQQFQDQPWLTDLYLAHSVKAMKKHYARQHFDELFKATDYLATVYGFDKLQGTLDHPNAGVTS
jgi:hypothetical protein